MKTTGLSIQKEKGLPNEERFWVNISFYGNISGEYFISIDEPHWRRIIGEIVNSEEEIDDYLVPSIKEVLNGACGLSIKDILKDFPNLTISSPKIIIGKIDYPRVHTFFSTIKSSDHGSAQLFLVLNLMRQGSVSKIEQAIEQQASALRELQKAESAFEAMKQGILVMDPEGQIILGSAKKFSSLFFNKFKDLIDKNIVNILPAEILKNEKDSFLIWIKTCFSIPDTMPWEDFLNLCPIPSEVDFIHAGKKFSYKIQFRKVQDHQQLLLVVEDISKEKELMKLIGIEQDKNNMIAKIAKDKDIFLDLNHDIEAFFRDSLSILSEQPDISLLEEIYRKLHTVKGGVLYFGFTQFIQEVHDTESKIKEFQSDKKTDISSALGKIRESILSLKRIYQNNILELDEIIPQKDLDESRELLAIDRNKFDRILLETTSNLEVKSSASLKTFLENQFKQLKKQNLRKVYQSFDLNISYLSGKFEKKIIFESEGEELELNIKPYQEVFSNLGHIVRNSIDHGIELENIRRQKDKNPTGVIKVKTEMGKSKLLIYISDDGIGLDSDEVLKKAVGMGIVEKAAADKLKESQVFELIFEHGFSSRDKTTFSSGRGVGLDAVRSSIQNIGGSIFVHSVKDMGTEFRIELPLIDQ